MQAKDTGSSPDLGRFHMPWSNEVHAPQLLSLHAATTENYLPRACDAQQEKPPQGEACTPQRTQLEKAGPPQWRPNTAKNK